MFLRLPEHDRLCGLKSNHRTQRIKSHLSLKGNRNRVPNPDSFSCKEREIEPCRVRNGRWRAIVLKLDLGIGHS